ncbi:alkaline phosphatase D family protein [Haliangium sp.]|uniref:alkaline phosphatase D family protein n=1 Tax=Haliangium sp. TaxID=2663208 RepID=UPI003D0BBB10
MPRNRSTARPALVLGPKQISNAVAVGATDHRSVRIWCRVSRPGTYRLTLRRGARVVGAGSFTVGGGRDNTTTVLYPNDFPGQEPLTPLTRYRFRVAREDELEVVGGGHFETFPARPEDTPARFSIGVMSCHQPFNSDGVLSPHRTRLLDALPRALDHSVKLLIAAGDQIYADEPGELSLFDERYSADLAATGGAPILSVDVDRIRAAYQDRYRSFWYPLPWRKLLSTRPVYPVLDDHDIVNNAGSVPEHQNPAWRRLFQGARLAYMDYQGSLLRPWDGRDLPAHFGYRADYGHTAIFAFDLRSQRRVGAVDRDARLIDEDQHEAFRRFLLERRGARVVLIVTSVPLIHIPEWLTAVGNAVLDRHVAFLDHWSLRRYHPDRDRVFDAIREQLAATQGKQKIVVVGGDVHVGAAFVLTWRDLHKHQFYQFTSSPVSNRLLRWQAAPSRWGPELFAQTGATYDDKLGVRLLRPSVATPTAGNPIAVQNFGLIDVESQGDRTHVRFRFLGADDDGGVRELFRTGLL